MGLFDLLGDIVRLPIAIVEDTIDLKIDKTVDNIKDIAEDVVDTVIGGKK